MKTFFAKADFDASAAGGMSGAALLNLPGLVAAAHPRIATTAALVLSIVGLAALGLIRFDNDIVRAITSDSQWSRAYLEFVDRVEQGSSDLVILAEAPTALSENGLSALRDLALDIELTEGVVTVMSPFSARFPRSHADYSGETVIPLEPAPEEVARRLSAYRAIPDALNPLLTGTLDTALIIAVVDDRSFAPEDILAEVQDTAANAAIPGVSLTVTGEDAISQEIVGAMKRDLLWLNLAGDLVGILIAAAIFRRPAAIVTATGPALSGALAALSMFALTGFPVTVLSNVIPILAYVLGLADGTHMVAHFTSLDRSRPKRERVLETVRAIGPACGLTAATTAVAFAAIALTDNEPLREFAIVGALATVAAYCSVMLWFVLLAGWLDPSISRNRTELPVPPVPLAIKRLALDRPRGVIVGGGALMAVAVVGYSTTTPWFSLYENLPETSAVRQAAETAEDKFGGFFRFWAEYDAPDRDTPEGWRALLEKTEILTERAPAGSIVSPAVISSGLGDADAPPTREDLDEIDNPVIDAILPPGEDIARVLVLTGDPMRSPDRLRIHDALEAAAIASGATIVTGLPVLMRHEPVDIVRQLSTGLAAACIICVMLIAAVYRNLRLAPALLLPNLLPLAVTASALHVLRDGHLTPTALLALTIAFGIAVDDSIHLVNRYVLERRAGHTEYDALSRAIDTVGKAMIATTLLICGGLLVTFTSDFSTIRLFGSMLIITFGVALAADLLLLPALLRARWFK